MVLTPSFAAANGIPILGLDRRITYVIGEDGRILRVYPQVDPGTHASEIIRAVGADKPRPVAAPPPTAAPTPAARTARHARPAADDSDDE